MKEKLLELLGLKADASDDAVIKAVSNLIQQNAAFESGIAKLSELLGLDADSTEQDVISAITSLQRAAVTDTDSKRSEKEITDLVAQSHGALSRDAARQVIADRKIHGSKSQPQKK